jgi:hypothetical protein
VLILYGLYILVLKVLNTVVELIACLFKRKHKTCLRVSKLLIGLNMFYYLSNLL